jgi:hypothetical protein
MQLDSSDIIELNVGGTHNVTTSRSTLTKYHTSLLATMFSNFNKLSTLKDKIFIDRDGEPFTKMISYLRTGLMPIFSSKAQKQAFKDELEFWQIPLGQPGNLLITVELENESQVANQFDDQWCAFTLHLENESRTIIKQGPTHGIVFLRVPLSEANPYVSFKVTISTLAQMKSNLFIGLVDRTGYIPEHLGKYYTKA